MENFSSVPSEPNWFPYGPELYGPMKDSLLAMFGPFSPAAWRRAFTASRLIKKRRNRGIGNGER